MQGNDLALQNATVMSTDSFCWEEGFLLAFRVEDAAKHFTHAQNSSITKPSIPVAVPIMRNPMSR